nr:efflux RND transporter periplasmic adaptor subunit [Bacteroides sp.]
MKRFFTPAIIASACLLFTLGGCKKKEQAPQQPTPAIDVANVVVDSVMLHKTYPGYLTADQKIDIVARVNGYLTSQNYTGGDIVKAGQVLFTIESTTYADQVRQAEAALSTAKSACEYATSHYEAVKKAMESDAVSQQELAQAESNMNQAKANIKSAQAALETARTNLSYCTIRAPRSGRMSASTISVGGYVSGAGSPFVLGTLYDDSMIDAVFTVDDASHLQIISAQANTPGVDYDHVTLNFDEPLPHTYTGKLNYQAPNIDTGTGTILLKAAVDNPYGELRAGMFVNILLPSRFDPQAIMVKDASIGTDQLGRYLYTVNDSNRVVYTPVKVGELINDTMRIVTEGLTPQSRYVTKALLKVRAGEEIRPVIVK